MPYLSVNQARPLDGATRKHLDIYALIGRSMHQDGKCPTDIVAFLNSGDSKRRIPFGHVLAFRSIVSAALKYPVSMVSASEDELHKIRAFMRKKVNESESSGKSGKFAWFPHGWRRAMGDELIGAAPVSA